VALSQSVFIKEDASEMERLYDISKLHTQLL